MKHMTLDADLFGPKAAKYFNEEMGKPRVELKPEDTRRIAKRIMDSGDLNNDKPLTGLHKEVLGNGK